MLSEENPAWFQEASTLLAHYHLASAAPADAWNRYQSEHPDAVLATPSSANLSFFERLHQLPHKRPLLALIVANVSDVPDPRVADLLLPPIPRYFDALLSAFWHVQTEQQRAQKEKQALLDENKRLKKEAQIASRSVDEINLLKNAIVRTVSHELKTPLLQVKSAVALLAEDAKDNRLAEYATNATARLEGIVKNISQLADSLDLEMSTGPVLVREIVDYAIRNLRRSWERKDDIPRIRIDLETNLPTVQGNKLNLGIVMQLLLDNALKFSDGEVQVRACRAEDGVVISVRDDGIGIANDKLEQIFESFYQVDSSSTRKYGGIGVGLAIVRLILERHDVKISVESTPGAGSTFTFALPVAQIRRRTRKAR
ncbi:MAG: HAMP domain-containing histidine kinase [Chloroflexi bacterium]|nr:HAMP domain-containing histidine kinase [Chloroflexota bacterium]